MKKPSKSFCSVCPKKLGQANTSDPDVDPDLQNKIVRKPKNITRKNQKRRKPPTFTHSSVKVMKRLAAMNQNTLRRRRPVAPRRVAPPSVRRITPPRQSPEPQQVSKPKVVQRRPAPVRLGRPTVRPAPPPKRNTNSKIQNHYYGIDHIEDVPRPAEGDIYQNILTGQVFIHTKGIWNLIPNNGPRCYLGENEEIISEKVPAPKEGDVYFAAESGKITIFQDRDWHDFSPITPSIIQQLTEVKAEIPHPHAQDDYASSVLHHQSFRSTENELRSKPFKIDLSNVKLEGEYSSLNLKHYKNINPEFSLDDRAATLEVAPEGLVNLSLKFNQPMNEPVEFSLESWVRYSDSHQNVWQTVTCLADLEVLDFEGKPIKDYTLNAENDDQLVDLKQKVRSFTTLARREKVTLTSSKPISQIKWISKLIAYPLKPCSNQSQPGRQTKDQNHDFYAVQFKDLCQPISLPRLGIKIIPVAA